LEKPISKKIIFLICWITYVCAYLCRVNLSSVLSKLESSLNVSTGLLGVLGSVFFISYAIGQLLNGFIGDRISPYKFIIIATLGTGVLNVLISASTNYYIIMICWALNGYFQSMFWGPLMRILSERFSKKDHVNISSGMSASMSMGFILSWGVLGYILEDFSWQYYFLIPSLGAFFMAIIWIFVGVKNKNREVFTEHKALNIKETIDTIFAEKLWIISLICICLGLIKESVSLWAPVILTKALGIDIKSSFIYILIIPLTNFGGIMLSKKLSEKFIKDIGVVLLILFSIVIVGSLTLIVFSNMPAFLSVAMIACISAMTYGCNNILLSFIPLSYSHKNMVSTLVGVFDFSSYVGAAISSFVLGLILINGDWRIIPTIWLVSSGLAIFLCKISIVQVSVVRKGGVINK